MKKKKIVIILQRFYTRICNPFTNARIKALEDDKNEEKEDRYRTGT